MGTSHHAAKGRRRQLLSSSCTGDAVDGEILTAGIALAPETMGLSVVVSLGAVVINDLVAEHAADYVQEEIPKVVDTLKNTGRKVGRWFKKLF